MEDHIGCLALQSTRAAGAWAFSPKISCFRPDCGIQGLYVSQSSPHLSVLKSHQGLTQSVKAEFDCLTSCQKEQGNTQSRDSQGQRQRSSLGCRSYIHYSAVTKLVSIPCRCLLAITEGQKWRSCHHAGDSNLLFKMCLMAKSSRADHHLTPLHMGQKWVF